jgi:hypothetical protein
MNDFAILLKVQNGQRPQRPGPDECNGNSFPDSLWYLVERCWAQDPKTRPSMGDVVTYFQTGEFSTNLAKQKGQVTVLGKMFSALRA